MFLAICALVSMLVQLGVIYKLGVKPVLVPIVANVSLDVTAGVLQSGGDLSPFIEY